MDHYERKTLWYGCLSSKSIDCGGCICRLHLHSCGESILYDLKQHNIMLWGPCRSSIGSISVVCFLNVNDFLLEINVIVNPCFTVYSVIQYHIFLCSVWKDSQSKHCCQIQCVKSTARLIKLVLHAESWGEFEWYLSKTTLQVSSATSIWALDLPSVSDVKYFKIGLWIENLFVFS